MPKNINLTAVCLLIAACWLMPLGLAYSQRPKSEASSLTPEESIIFYENALKKNPNDYVALTALGNLYANARGEIEKSMNLFEEAIKINDQYDLAHLGLGMDYASLGMLEEARFELHKAIRVSKRKYIQDAARQVLLSLEEEGGPIEDESVIRY